MENYRLQSLRRPEIIVPKVQRIDTSTEYYSNNYTNIVPKSILKSGTSTTPPISLPSTPYFQIQQSRPSSKDDEPFRTSVKINTDQSIPLNYPINTIEKRISIEPILFQHRIKFANVSQLNDIEWEVPREFQTIHSNHERTPPAIIGSKIHKFWQHEMNINQSHYLSNNDITQQQAFEY
jgi:hypothetical protein